MIIQGADEVLPRLWIGDANACAAAHAAGFHSICVLESACGVAGCIHAPILQDGVAKKPMLHATADEIHHHWGWRSPPLLVHCGAGVERSPLAVAWWMKRNFGFDFDASYAWLQQRRPVVADRRVWIEP